MASFEQELADYRAARIARVASATGPLTLVDRHELVQGANELPIGTATLVGDALSVDAAPGVSLSRDGVALERPVLRSKDDGGPLHVEHAGKRWELVRHGEAFAVRVRDPNSAARRAFTGLDFYVPALAWRIVARFEAYDPPRSIELGYDGGVVVAEPCPGAAVFEIAGQEHRIDLLLQDGPRLFILFRDATNRDDTYGGGRYFYAEPPSGGRVVLDFNKAFNPACVFTPYVACPMVPPQNRLPMRVEAGEKLWRAPDG